MQCILGGPHETRHSISDAGAAADLAVQAHNLGLRSNSCAASATNFWKHDFSGISGYPCGLACVSTCLICTERSMKEHINPLSCSHRVSVSSLDTPFAKTRSSSACHGTLKGIGLLESHGFSETPIVRKNTSLGVARDTRIIARRVNQFRSAFCHASVYPVPLYPPITSLRPLLPAATPLHLVTEESLRGVCDSSDRAQKTS